MMPNKGNECSTFNKAVLGSLGVGFWLLGFAFYADAGQSGAFDEKAAALAFLIVEQINWFLPARDASEQ